MGVSNRSEHNNNYGVVFVLSGVNLALLVWLSLLEPPGMSRLWPGILFWGILIFCNTFAIPLGEGSVSLVPMVLVATCLVLGPIPTGWIAFLAAVAHGAVRGHAPGLMDRGTNLSFVPLVAVSLTNAAMHSLSILAAGFVYLWLGGKVPLFEVMGGALFSWIPPSLVFLTANYLFAAPLITVLRGREHLQLFLRSLPDALLYEGLPLPFAPLMALIYVHLGPFYLVLFFLILAAVTFITRSLAHSSRRLERRVQELHSLQAVGQVLSANLDVGTIVSAIYEQVTPLMPAENFYVALYNPELDEVSFPLAVEEGVRVRWRSRRTGNGLTEHILRTGDPLLISENVFQRLEELGIQGIGRSATCWLGVPLIAGEELLGVIAVQSYSTDQRYTLSDREILNTIAAQAAVAIQNARLYERTDEALAQRVQEFNSILRTTRDGIMLLSVEWCVLAVNRALAEFIGISQLELSHQCFWAGGESDQNTVLQLIGYTWRDLQQDCEDLVDERWTQKQDLIVLGAGQRHVERALTPVRDGDGKITGWLLVLRDVTEEVELSRLREETTHMLIHDLRSPLTVIMGSMALIQNDLHKERIERLPQLLSMATQNSERMLTMVNQLLDIGQLESGSLPLNRRVVDVGQLLKEMVARVAPLASEARIVLTTQVESDLPGVDVDPELVGRVLENLLDNAVKFTPNGGRVRLWAYRGAEGNGHNFVVVGVSDTGPGISEEEQQYIFEKFRRGKAKGRRPGTGLGLPFCKLVVEAHEGRIWVESAEGQGNTFLVSLPTP